MKMVFMGDAEKVNLTAAYSGGLVSERWIETSQLLPAVARKVAQR